MNKTRKYLILFIPVFLLFSIIIFLAIKIINLNDSRIKGIQNVFVIKKKDLIFDPGKYELKYFYEPKPNSIEISDEPWVGSKIKYTINSDSLNEIYEYPLFKDVGTYRIITIGDSITYGQNVNTKDNYSKQLEVLLNHNLSCKGISKFEVINLGVYGYDIEYEATRYLKRGAKYNPDMVIWLIDNWNFWRVNEITIPEVEKLKKEGLSNSYDPGTKSYPAFSKALDLSSNQLTKENIRMHTNLALVRIKNYLPREVIYMTFENMEKDYLDLIQNNLNPGMDKSNYLFFDFLYKNNVYLTNDGLHPNIGGHRKIAEELMNNLAKHQFNYCKKNN